MECVRALRRTAKTPTVSRAPFKGRYNADAVAISGVPWPDSSPHSKANCATASSEVGLAAGRKIGDGS